MLLSRLLSLGSNTHCDHERSVVHSKMTRAHLSNEYSAMYEEIEEVIQPLVASHNKRGMIYGECSGLLYFVFGELHRRYGGRARFVLLTRKPDGFVRSALARGFFDPDHPHALEHLRAHPTTEIGQRWDATSPFEKCMWYWGLVNGMVYEFFHTLPKDLWRIQRIEELDIAACRELYGFLRIDGFDESAVERLLSLRVNATPGLGDERDVNPWSHPLAVGEPATWSRAQRSAYRRWAEPLCKVLYANS